MSNIKINSISLNSSKGEWAYTGSELIKEENKAFLDEVVSLGEGKGIPFTFKKGEVCTVPSWDDVIIIKRIVSFHNQEYPVLSMYVESNFRGDIEVPLSIFRRVPAFESDQKLLFEKFPLSEQLASSQLGDLGRIKVLVGTKFTVAGELKLLRQTFTQTPQGYVRDDEETVRTKGLTVTCYQVAA